MVATSKLVSSVLTAASAPQMKDSHQNTKAWADWLHLSLHNDPEISALVNTCSDFVMDFKEKQSPRWLTLMGVTGTGKTHCGNRIWGHLRGASDWRRTVFQPKVIYWPAFVSELRSGTAFDQYRDMWNWPVLFLDDIGAERDTTGFASEQLNTLLGCRVGKWTIMTSNLMLEQIGAIDPRIADRIIRQPNRFIEINTESHSMRVRMPFKD